MASLLKWHGFVGDKRVEVRTDHCSLENHATEEPKTLGGPSLRQARWHELFSNIDLHVVYTPGPVNPVGHFLSRWAYPANPALGDVRDMMAVVAPVVTRSKAAPRAIGPPACDPPPLLSAPVGGGRSKRNNFRNLSESTR